MAQYTGILSLATSTNSKNMKSTHHHNTLINLLYCIIIIWCSTIWGHAGPLHQNMCDAHMTLWTLDRHRHNYWNSSSGNGFEAWEGARPREKSMADSWEKLFVSYLLCTSSLATKHAGTGLNGRWIQLPNCTNFYSCSCFDTSCLLSSFEDDRSVIYFILLRFVLPCPTHHIIHVTSPSSFSFP